MKQFFALLKVLLKTGLGGGTAKKTVKVKNKFGTVVGTKEKSRGTGIFILIGICMIPLMILLFQVSYTSTLALMMQGDEMAAINVACSIVCLTSFIMGFTVVLSVFYFTSDIQTLLCFPISAEKIVAAKFIVTLIYEYPIDVIILTPLLAGVGAATSAGPTYWVIMVLVVLLLPITPLIYGGIISMIAMRISKMGKHRDMFTVIITIIIVAGALGINLVTNSFGRMSQAQIASAMTNVSDSLGAIVSKIFPMIIPAQHALHESSILWLLLFIALIVALFIVFMLVARALYIKGVMDISDSESKGKALTEKETKKIVVKRNVLKSYTLKELKIVLRTPAFLVNCVLMAFIWPLIMVIPFAAGFGFDRVGSFVSSVTSGGEFSYAIALSACIVITGLVGWFNFTNAVAITKEGNNFFFMKIIPVPIKTQLRAKHAAGLVIGNISSFAYCIVVFVLFKMPPLMIVLALIISFLCTMFFNYTMLWIDILRPKLQWENETAAIKQNFNSVISMLLVMLSSVIISGVPILLHFVFGVNMILLAVIMIIGLLIANFLADKVVISGGVQKINEIQQ